MNNQLRPNLVEPEIATKVIRTLKNQQPDYWRPAKITAKSIYQNYIRPNISVVILVLLFGLFLVYRYRSVRDRREMIEPKEESGVTDVLLHLYEKQKEFSHEPKIKQFNERVVKPASLAYPMYPYGGTLAPGSSR